MVKVSASDRKKLLAVKAKRSATVIRHILKHGQITSLELLKKYGYEHPPRAVRDVRELGIPVETFRVKNPGGRLIAAYRFGDLSKWGVVSSKSLGRTAITKALKKALVERFGSKCAIYLEAMNESVLQVDHRIPYEIAGENADGRVEAFMLLCPSANRAKSWTCEHCENWQKKDAEFCLRCFWAHPEKYEHVAGKVIRQIVISFSGDEIEDYEKLIRLSGESTAQETVKRILHEHLK